MLASFDWVQGIGRNFRLPGRRRHAFVPQSPRVCDPGGGELPEGCSSSSPSGYHLKEVTARLQWMGQMGWEDRRRGSYPCRQLRDKGQGPGIEDQGSGTKAKSAGGETFQPGLQDGTAQRLSVAEGVDRWAGKLGVALTRSTEDHHRHCPRWDDSPMDPEVG